MGISQPPARRGLVVVWLLYFFQFGAIGMFFPFLNIYYLQNGMTGTQIGLIGMAGAAVGVLGASAWGYLGDRMERPGVLLVVGAVAASLVLQLVPLMHSFWGYLLLSCVTGLVTAGLLPLVDSLTLGLLGNKSEDYGRYRLGGSLGYIVATACAGVLYEKVGLGWIFLAYGVVMVGYSAAALFLPRATLRLEAREQKGIGKMIHQPIWLVFVAALFLVWIAASGIINYMGIAIKSMGGSDSLVGLSSSLGALAEIPFMIFSGRWMRRFGAQNMLWFAMLAFGGRLALYGWMPDPNWAIFIGMLNGPTYVLFWNSAVNYARQLAPAGYQATAQGMLGSITSLGTVVSALFCGFLFDQIGARGMFWVLAASCVAGFLIFGVGNLRRQVPARG